MPRPRKSKLIQQVPPATFYKPQGVPLARLKGLTLTLEGLEAMRLADAEGLDQAQAAARMGVSPATFCRVLAEARAAVARALSSGMAIRIEGGDYQVAPPSAAPGLGGGQGHGRGWRGGR
ncbi:MAG: DUF134 domain-containing protein [Desulfarculus sp.]|nr:MAG: DUF134 domain-containing protein [Desulfarculus sp.]